MDEIILGSHVGMSGKDMFLGSVNEADGYGANALMVYTGAPQNTRRKPLSELNIEAGLERARQVGIREVVVHAPYIINLANSVKPDTFELGVEFLAMDLQRAAALGAKSLVLHPGSHVGAGAQAGIEQLVKGLDQVLDQDESGVFVALETMAGKGSELGWKFEQLRWIIDHARYGERLGVCMDTCHMHDAGYDVQDLDGLLAEFDRVIGIQRIAAVHVNDSRNVRGARKDRHANIGFGEIGFDALSAFVHHPALSDIVKILETPYVEGHAPYGEEIAMLKQNTFDPSLMDQIRRN